MSNFNVFMNNTIVSNDSPSISDTSVALGDWCLTPVRCLFGGNKVTVVNENKSFKVEHEQEYAPAEYGWDQPKGNILKIVASIGLIIPGVILGSVFKGLGYSSQSIRERHNLAVQHYTPVYTIGSPDERLDLEGIKRQLEELKEKNTVIQPGASLVVYAEEDTKIKRDPGFLDLAPQKIILVGATIVNGPSIGTPLDDILASKQDWEGSMIRSVSWKPEFNDRRLVVGVMDVGTHVTQFKTTSVEAALQDIPPPLSSFSFQRYKRIYVVV